MILKRREKQPLRRKIRESVWPSMGWLRTYNYFRHRIFRQEQTPRDITAGLAIGAAISFTPLIGTHFFQTVGLAWLFRVNIPAAVVGTAMGNPWTFPPMFWLDYKVGEFIFRLFGADNLVALPDTLSWGYLLDHPLKLFLPLVVGGYICATLFFPIAYAMLYYPVRAMQEAYHAQRRKRRRERKQQA